MDPIMQAIYFGRADEYIQEHDPRAAEQLPETQNDVYWALHNYRDNPTEENGQAVIRALRGSGQHAEADQFAMANLKKKPRFTIEE